MLRGGDEGLAQLRRGVAEFCVLAFLRSGKSYRFDLARALVDAGGIIAGEGTIYPLLARLRRKQYVRTTWYESPSRPPRRYYGLTPEGEEALRTFIAHWERFKTSVNSLVAGGIAQ